MEKDFEINQSKMIFLLKSLDLDEIKKLRLWLCSPIHNQNKEVILLFNRLRKSYPDFNRPIRKSDLLSDRPTKTWRPQDDIQLRRLMHHLSQQIQDFLVWKRLQAEPVLSKRWLMDALLERRLYQFIPSILKKAKKYLASSPGRNQQYYYHAYLLEEMEHYLNTLLRNRSIKHNTQELLNKIRHYALILLLRYYCAAINREFSLKIKYQYPLLPFIKQGIAQQNLDIPPILRMYYHNLELLQKQGDVGHYYEMKTCFFESMEQVDYVGQRRFLNYMLNHCNRLIRNGAEDFKSEKHIVLEKGLALKVWETGSYFPAQLFIINVKNSIELDKKESIIKFIEAYASKLNMDVRDDIVNLAYGLYYHYCKDLDKAHTHLVAIQSKSDFMHYLAHKILLIKIYYERDKLTVENMDTHALNGLVESIRLHLVESRNTNLSQKGKIPYSNFINIFKHILSRYKSSIFSGDVTKGDMDELLEGIHTISPLREREWLKQITLDLKASLKQ